MKITLATKQPLEDDTVWSYPLAELEDLLAERPDDEFEYYQGRLYEKGE